MKKLFFALILLAAPVQAVCPRFQSFDANTQQEIYGICHDLQYPQISTGTAQNFTIVKGSFTNASGTTLNFTTGTINSFMVVGPTSNTDPPIGRIGQFTSVVTGNVAAAATNTFQDTTSLALTAGNWLVVGSWYFQPKANTTLAEYGLSTGTTGNSFTDDVAGDTRFDWTVLAGQTTMNAVVVMRYSLAASATVLMKTLYVYTGVAPGTIGKIQAWRL